MAGCNCGRKKSVPKKQTARKTTIKLKPSGNTRKR